MSYAIQVSKSFLRSLSLLPDKIKPGIVEFVYGSLATNPYRVGKALTEPLEGMWSARRGEYRILYEVDDKAQTIHVMAVRHRRDAYRIS
jgi:mRNA-degrading endonuclease RelE of RelBE toxin-antitoxin system